MEIGLQMNETDQIEESLAEQVASSDVTVLIGGETGTGKGRMARRIHAMSPRASKPFVPVDCAALPDALFESQLFGYKKGAFTGATSDRMGLIRAAEGGTLFLDEVGELTLEQQAKLLVFIQERSVLPVGEVERTDCDIRLITATHRDLPTMVRCGEFREDLYYRFAVIEMTMPPLRDHLIDLPDILDELVETKASLLHVEKKRVTSEYLEALMSYEWPGNIRELGNIVERSLVLSKGAALDVRTLPTRIRQQVRARTSCNGQGLSADQLQDALLKHSGNKAATARSLGISRRHLYRVLKRHNMDLTRTEPVF